jgi:mono/diheme cytochrome c family protein
MSRPGFRKKMGRRPRRAVRPRAVSNALVLAAAARVPMGIAFAALVGATASFASDPIPGPLPPDLDRGRSIFEATGGCTCHTNYPGEGDAAPELAGGRALETPFGIFYSTNITPDPETGLGRWNDEDFIRAMRQGLSPKGDNYFPVFPYPAFAGLRDQDLRDLKAYLDSRPPVDRANKPPGAPFPLSWRPAISGWKWLNFAPAPIPNDPIQSPEWNRGQYLVRAAAHCGECHTPRTLTGGLDDSLRLAGSRDGPEGELAPNITPDRDTGIGRWSQNDLVWYLETGFKPDGDDTQGLMSEVIEHGYSRLSQQDLGAIATYILSLDPIQNKVTGPSSND